MGGFVNKRSLTVAPFECAWAEELRFREPGRGCVAFEASAHNDVTLVFRHHPGSHRYHYRTDTSRHYTVILGSHRNKRLRIQVDGATVADVAAPGLCCANSFQPFWVTICDGLIAVGQGSHPDTNLLFRWLDPDPNPDVQYVGLSSWDKHVGYRNITILPLPAAAAAAAPHNTKLLCSGKHQRLLLADFLESWDLSDAVFVVGTQRKLVPAHRVVLCASGDFPFQIAADTGAATIQLPSVSYPVLRALLEYIYTGSTQVTKLLSLFSSFFPYIKPTTKSLETGKPSSLCLSRSPNVC
jgi:hypothetical protein